jgi:hypothetical protein
MKSQFAYERYAIFMKHLELQIFDKDYNFFSYVVKLVQAYCK